MDLKPVPDHSHLSGRLGALGIVMTGEPDRVRSMGTGFLVSSCHVLTAGHIIAQGEGQVRDGTSVRFAPKMGNVTAAAVWGKVVAAGQDFISKGASGQIDTHDGKDDWALIELERPLKNVEPFKMLYPGAALTPSAAISAVGYTSSVMSMPSVNVHDSCRIRQDFPGKGWLYDLLIADCAVRSGMSGGPLLVDTGDQLVALGIVVQRVEVGEKVAAIAVSIHSLADKIAPVMRASEVCAVGQPYAFPSTVPARTAALDGK